jgi:hypothetical protein
MDAAADGRKATSAVNESLAASNATAGDDGNLPRRPSEIFFSESIDCFNLQARIRNQIPKDIFVIHKA